MSSEPSIWTAPPSSPSLESGTVDVWLINLELEPEVVNNLSRTLESDELARAARFHFDRDRRRFIVGRGSLRQIVSSYLGTGARALRFDYGPYGKPSLQDAGHLRFNLSHAHEVGLVAIAPDAELGVDVERIREDFAGADIARRFFSPLEVDSFNALPVEDQVAAFFRCWTRKEAYIKAIGKGLSKQLDQFDVTLAPGVAAALLRAEEDDISRWWLGDIEVGPGYAGALMVEGRPRVVRYFRAPSHIA